MVYTNTGDASGPWRSKKCLMETLVLSRMTMGKQNILTMAYGRSIYTEMAVNLARSYLKHSRSSIGFLLATDMPSQVPKSVANKVNVIDLGRVDIPVGRGFIKKLYMDILVGCSPGEYLFVDSDCLFYGCPSIVFKHLSGTSFSAIGNSTSSGEWFGDISSRCEDNIVPSVPTFVGAVYYYRLDGKPHPVLETARELAPSYDKLGMIRLRGHENEEPLISLGMALTGHKPYSDIDLEIKVDAMFCDLSRSKANALSGYVMLKIQPNAMITSPRQEALASPCIIHYNDSYVKHWLYVRDALTLRLFDLGLGFRLSRFFASLICFPEYLFWPFLKTLVRPFYHRFFGYRQVAKNIRL